MRFENDIDIINEFREKKEIMDIMKDLAKHSSKQGEYTESHSDSSEEEATDVMEVINKEFDKLKGPNKGHNKYVKKLNPYAHAQAEFKKSRVISKRLNTLSIFVKKDTDIKQHDGIFDDEDKDQSKNFSKSNPRK